MEHLTKLIDDAALELKRETVILFSSQGYLLAAARDRAPTVVEFQIEGSPSDAPTTLADLVGADAADQFIADGAGRTSPTMAVLASNNRQADQVVVELRRLVGREESYILATIGRGTLPPPLPTDALTGLPDRRAIPQWVSSHLGRPPTDAGNYAALFLDLDQFKEVNDRYSHAAGDAVLVELARRWLAAVRHGDLVTRYGGDEFVILLNNVANVEAAQPVVERLLQATGQPIGWEGAAVTVTATIGVAIGDRVSEVDRVIAQADRQLYGQKRHRAK